MKNLLKLAAFVALSLTSVTAMAENTNKATVTSALEASVAIAKHAENKAFSAYDTAKAVRTVAIHTAVKKRLLAAGYAGKGASVRSILNYRLKEQEALIGEIEIFQSLLKAQLTPKREMACIGDGKTDVFAVMSQPSCDSEKEAEEKLKGKISAAKTLAAKLSTGITATEKLLAHDVRKTEDTKVEEALATFEAAEATTATAKVALESFERLMAKSPEKLEGEQNNDEKKPIVDLFPTTGPVTKYEGKADGSATMLLVTGMRIEVKFLTALAGKSAGQVEPKGLIFNASEKTLCNASGQCANVQVVK